MRERESIDLKKHMPQSEHETEPPAYMSCPRFVSMPTDPSLCSLLLKRHIFNIYDPQNLS